MVSEAALRGRGWPCASSTTDSTTISATADVLVVIMQCGYFVPFRMLAEQHVKREAD